MTDRYERYYIDFIECDFCGQSTKGRVYPHSLTVVCGSCHKPLKEVPHEEDDKVWDELTNSAGSL